MTRSCRARLALVLAGALIACQGAPAQTQAPTPAAASPAARPAEALRFAKGANSVTVSGRLKGPQTDVRDYLVRVRGGQVLRVDLVTMSTSTYFHVMPPAGDDEALFRGEMEPHPHWSGMLRRGGDYRVRVFLNRSRAREGRDATYTLTVTLQ